MGVNEISTFFIDGGDLTSYRFYVQTKKIIPYHYLTVKLKTVAVW